MSGVEFDQVYLSFFLKILIHPPGPCGDHSVEHIGCHSFPPFTLVAALVLTILIVVIVVAIKVEVVIVVAIMVEVIKSLGSACVEE